jgi:type I restriction enzyme M protein
MAGARNGGGDLNFEAELFKAADKLRGNLEPSEYQAQSSPSQGCRPNI